MKKHALLIALLLISFLSFSQEKESRFDFRIGIGPSLWGSGDHTLLNYENELNYKLNSYFTVATEFNFGGLPGIKERKNFASYILVNPLIFYSPFKNNEFWDFRIGLGVGFISISQSQVSGSEYFNNMLIKETYRNEKLGAASLNLAIENNFQISENYLLGIKLFTQPYSSGDINSGIMLKFGRRL
ncbi:MAG: hypothetical protein RIR51_1554 [Bacteroidota bacterium]|jgi:hypothetical protein